MANARMGILASVMLLGNPALSTADSTAAGETIRLPGVEITEEGINMPGVTIDSGGIKVPGVTIGGATQPAGAANGKRFVASDLRGHDFRGQDLSGAIFTASDLRGALFTNANLEGAVFTGCDLRGAHLSGANLKGARFEGDDMRGTALTNSCLVNAKIVGNDLDQADFTGAVLVGAQLVSNDMGGTTTSGARFDGPAKCASETAAARPAVTSAQDIKTALIKAEGKVDLTVNFEHDSDKVQSEGHVQILEIANALKSPELESTRVRIEGHTDATGGSDYNMDLSYRRAITVMRALSEQYTIPGSRFEVKGFGENQPIASNDTDAGRALNRRVTLVNLSQ